MRPIVVVSLAVVGIAAAATAALVWSLRPSSIGAYAFILTWTVAPYVVMGSVLLLRRRSGDAPVWPWCLGVVAISAAGVYLMADVIVWNLDPQGAIAVFLIPLLQGIGLAATLVVVWLGTWILRRATSGTDTGT